MPIINLDEDSRIVDTPGFSNLKFDFLLPHDVDNLFEEMIPYKGLCKFQDCLHIQPYIILLIIILIKSCILVNLLIQVKLSFLKVSQKYY